MRARLVGDLEGEVTLAGGQGAGAGKTCADGSRGWRGGATGQGKWVLLEAGKRQERDCPPEPPEGAGPVLPLVPGV